MSDVDLCVWVENACTYKETGVAAKCSREQLGSKISTREQGQQGIVEGEEEDQHYNVVIV